jgi:hypothetical protein
MDIKKEEKSIEAVYDNALEQIHTLKNKKKTIIRSYIDVLVGKKIASIKNIIINKFSK